MKKSPNYPLKEVPNLYFFCTYLIIFGVGSWFICLVNIQRTLWPCHLKSSKWRAGINIVCSSYYIQSWMFTYISWQWWWIHLIDSGCCVLKGAFMVTNVTPYLLAFPPKLHSFLTCHPSCRLITGWSVYSPPWYPNYFRIRPKCAGRMFATCLVQVCMSWSIMSKMWNYSVAK